MRQSEIICVECGASFVAPRISRQYCSGRCKGATFRRGEKAKLTVLEKLFEQYVPKVEKKLKVDLFA
jgi:ribosomal protein S27AE